MKIRRIELQNYRNHTQSVLDIDSISFVVVRGSNHAGKSTIRDSISMGLALTSSSLDPQGRNFTRKIKRGADKAVIRLDVQGGKHVIQQSVLLNTNTSGRTSRCICLDDPDWKPLPFENFLTRYKDALMVAMNSDYFLHRMGEKEQKTLLAKLALPERYDFPQDKIDGVTKVLGEGAIDFNGEPFAVIDKAYKKLYEERSIVNRQVKEFVIPEPSSGPNIGSLPATVDSYSLQKEVDAAREEQQNINAEKDAAVKAANEVEVKRGKLQTKIDNLREKCRELDEKKKTADQSILPPDGVEALRSVAARAELLTQLKTVREENLRRIKEIEAVNARYEEIPDAGTTCPTCDQVIDPERIQKLAAANGMARREAVDKVAEAETKIRELGDVEAAISNLASHDKAVKEKEEASTALADKIKEGKAAVDELKGLGISTDAAAQFAEPLEKIGKKIDELLEKLRPIIAAEERKVEIAKLTKAKESLQQKAATVNELVEYFDKDGIKATLLAEHVGGFEKRINETLAAWGYKCDVSIEPYEFQVTNVDGDTCPVTELSDSEELMFSVAFQGAVSRAAGIGFIVADRMDTFDAEERQKANRTLYRMATDGTLEQVILVMTDKSVEVPKLPNAKFFFVEKGNVRELTAQ